MQTFPVFFSATRRQRIRVRPVRGNRRPPRVLPHKKRGGGQRPVPQNGHPTSASVPGANKRVRVLQSALPHVFWTERVSQEQRAGDARQSPCRAAAGLDKARLRVGSSEKVIVLVNAVVAHSSHFPIAPSSRLHKIPPHFVFICSSSALSRRHSLGRGATWRLSVRRGNGVSDSRSMRCAAF